MLDCSFQKSVPQKKAPLPPPPKFIWDPSKQEHFKLLLAQKVDVFNSINEGLSSPDCSIENTDLLIKLLTDTIYKCTSQCFKLAKKRLLPRKPKKKPWYTLDCAETKKRLSNLAKLFRKKPKDPYIRGKFISVRKQYRTLISWLLYITDVAD